MSDLRFTAIYEKAEEGGYIGYVAELPGANTQGETLEETRENLKEAVPFYSNATARMRMIGLKRRLAQPERS